MDEMTNVDETHEISPFNQDYPQPNNQSVDPYFSGGISLISNYNLKNKDSPMENRSPSHRQ